MRFYISLLLLYKSLFAFNMQDIEGIWEIPEESEGKVSIAEIFIHNNKAHVYAFMYANKEDNRLILRNIDEESSDARNLRNMIFLSNLEFDGEEWDNGKIYRPSNGKVYNASATLSNDKSCLKVRVSLDGFGFLGRTLEWHRLSSEDFTPPNHDEVGIISVLKIE